MKFVHEVDPQVNYVPMYSIEYKPVRNPYPSMPETWNQYALVSKKWEAAVLAMEVRLRYRKGYKRRTRVL